MSTLLEVCSEALSKTQFSHLLMNKDDVVTSVNILSNQIEPINPKKLPYGFEDIKSWLEERKKFSCARDIKEFFYKIGIKSDEDFIEVTHCVSLSDTFWIKSVDSKLRWENVSPWINNYSDVISTYALEGILVQGDKNYFSPVVSTFGSFPHTWKFNEYDKSIKFIKAGSKYTLGGINSGREPFSEYYASVIAKELGFNCVEYTIRNHIRCDGRIDVVTECSPYTSEKIGAIPSNKLGIKSYEDIIEYSKNLSKESFETVVDMLFLDCLLLNTDRHFGNIEFLMYNDSLEIVGVAPIFDNNYSLLPRFIEELEEFDIKEYRVRDGRTFEELFNLVKQYKDFKPILLKAKSIVLEKPKRVKIKESRLKFLNNFLQAQVDYLLSIL